MTTQLDVDQLSGLDNAAEPGEWRIDCIHTKHNSWWRAGPVDSDSEADVRFVALLVNAYRAGKLRRDIGVVTDAEVAAADRAIVKHVFYAASDSPALNARKNGLRIALEAFLDARGA